MRLFLIAIFLLAPATAWADEISSNGNWLLTESIDPITDEDTSAVINITGERSDDGLGIRCKDGSYEIMVGFSAYIALPQSNTKDIIYRFIGEESTKPMQARWNQSSNPQVVFVPLFFQHDFLSQILEYDGLVVRTNDSRGNTHTVQFDLRGNDGLIEQLSCIDLSGEEDSGEEAPSEEARTFYEEIMENANSDLDEENRDTEGE